MVINGLQINETKVLNRDKNGNTFTVNDLISFILENAEAIKKNRARIQENKGRDPFLKYCNDIKSFKQINSRWHYNEPWFRPDEKPEL